MIDDSPKDLYSAPRILDLASLLVVTGCYGVLFAVMTWMMVSVSVFIYLFALVTCAAISQAVLFQAKAPRLASSLVGLSFGVYAFMQMEPRTLRKFDLGYVVWRLLPEFVLESKPLMILLGMGFGIFVGYLAGTCVGGVFLISHRLRLALQRYRLARAWSGDQVTDELFPTESAIAPNPSSTAE
jgi:hypothetical protein